MVFVFDLQDSNICCTNFIELTKVNGKDALDEKPNLELPAPLSIN